MNHVENPYPDMHAAMASIHRADTADLLSNRAVEVAVGCLFVLVMLFTVWWPGFRSSVSALDIVALAASPLLLLVRRAGRVGVVFLWLLGVFAILSVYWIVVSGVSLPYFVVTARIVEGWALFWLAVFAAASGGAEKLYVYVRIIIVSAVAGALLSPLLGGPTGFYGFVALPFDAGPIQGGSVFTLSAFLCLALGDEPSQASVRPTWAVLYGACAALAVMTLSRSATFALLATLPLVLWRYWRFLPWVLLGMAGAALAYVASTWISGVLAIGELNRPELPGKVSERLGRVAIGANSRWEKWLPLLQESFSGPLRLLLGSGSGSSAAFSLPGSSFFNRDSQYVRSLYEFGLLGSLAAHGILLLRLALPFDRQQLALFLTFMAMIGMLMTTHEVLLVSKPMSMIMLSAGLLLGFALKPAGSSAGRHATPGVDDTSERGDPA